MNFWLQLWRTAHRNEYSSGNIFGADYLFLGFYLCLILIGRAGARHSNAAALAAGTAGLSTHKCRQVFVGVQVAKIAVQQHGAAHAVAPVAVAQGKQRALQGQGACPSAVIQ